MNLKLYKKINDVRGNSFIFQYGNNHVNLVTIKKGYVRGGHYYKFKQKRIMLSGKIRYIGENIVTGRKENRIIIAPSIIDIKPNVAHNFIALEDVLFLEISNQRFKAINFPKLRKIVEEKMKSKM